MKVPTLDLGTVANSWRTLYADTSVLTPTVDVASAVPLSIGTTTATAITLGRTGVTTTNAGALTVSQLLTGNLGATIVGATTSINASSNFATNINTGTSNGAINIGNSASTTTLLGTTNINVSGSAPTSIGNAAGTLTLRGNREQSSILIGNSGLDYRFSADGYGNICSGMNCTALNIVNAPFGSEAITIGGGGHEITITGEVYTNINTTGTSSTEIGNSTGGTTILGATSINFSGTKALSIGNASAGLLTLQGNITVDNSGAIENLSTYNSPYGGFGPYGNLIARSDALNAADWSATNITVTSNNTTSPNGLTTAERLVSTASGTHTLTQAFTSVTSMDEQYTTSAGNNTYTFSVWLRGNAGIEDIQLRIDSNGTPATGTAVSFSDISTTWKRYSVSQTFTSGVTTITPTIVMTNSVETVYGWGAQLEQASRPGVYVTTTFAGIGSSTKRGLVSNGGAHILSETAGSVALTVQGRLFQSSDLLQVQNSASTNLFAVSAAGLVTISSAINTRPTNGATGLPLTVQPGFVNVGAPASAVGGILQLYGGESQAIGGTGGAVSIVGGSASGASGTRTGGAVNIDGGTGTTTNGSISIGTLANPNTITIGNSAQTTALTLQTGSGSINIGNDAVGKTINIASAGGVDVQQTINIGGGAISGFVFGSKTVSIANGTIGSNGINTVNIATAGSTAGTAAVTIGSVGAAAHTLLLQGGNGTGASAAVRLTTAAAGDILIGNSAQTGTITLGQNATGTTSIVNISSANGTSSTQTINIGAGTSTTSGGKIVNIATGAPGASTTNTIAIGTGGGTTGTVGITIGSNANAAHTLALQGGSGATAITLTPQTTGQIVIGSTTGTGQITVGSSNTTQTVVIGNGTGVATVNIANAGTAGNSVGIAGAATANGATDTVNIATGNTAGTGSKVVNIASGTPAGAGIHTVTIGTVTNASITTIRGGTGPTALALQSGSGGTITIGANAASTINVGTGAFAHTIAIGTDATATQGITLGSASALSTTVIQGGTGATAVSIQAAATGTITIGSVANNNISIGSAAINGTLSIGGTGAHVGAISLGTGSGVQIIDLATGGTGAKTVTLGSTASSSSVTINTGTNGINIGTNAVASTITIGNATGATAVTINTGSGLLNFGTTQAQFTEVTGTRTLGVQTRTTSVAGTNLTVSAGTGGTGAANAGGILSLQGGAAGATGNANGGNAVLSGGAGVGTGVSGLVVISNPSYSTATAQNFTVSASITQANIDSFGSVLLTSNASGYTATLGDPTITTAGRVIYVTNSGSFDITLSVNGGGSGNTVTLKPNTTATMIWNGSDWTAAGASSSTDLQAAYNNTATSAGGAELVLNASGGAADGLTIRNNTTTPISGGILEVQSSIGTNLFSVNNFGTELAANGGSETSGTFATDWTAAPAGGTVTRTTTAAQYVTGQAGAQAVTTTTNHGMRNNLSGNPVVSTTYQVSFTAKLSSGTFSTLQVAYSHDGGTTLTQCTNYSTQTLSTSIWTKITCTITTPATAVTNPDLIIRQTDATGRTFWVDNLSFMRNDSTTQPSNVQIGGGISGGPITLFTLDRSTAPPVANGDTTYLGSMYYDITTGRIQCYEADGWGACGSAPDNIITLTPEYPGAVLNGSGVGTVTADFCSNQAAVLVVGTLCSSGEARNFYRWTSPQATNQTYSIYVTYKLPSTFKVWNDANTIKLSALSSDTTLASATLQVFRKTSTPAVSSCGSATTINSSNNTWQQTNFGGDETACGFTGSDYVIFKIDVIARSNANIYVENLDFTFTNN